ncbi:hypothetical protein EMN47_05570 [Prolixibacteraceae bacterium JC049]|nr:hypothetical protein [Prolixibacteraceae bacterium JC049]
MNKQKPTLAIYGIQDRNDFEHPMYVHDHNLAIMQNGKVEKFMQLERVTRRKRDNHLHQHLTDVIKEQKMVNRDFDLVFVDNVVGRSFISSQGNIRFEAPLNNKLSADIEKGRCWWFDREMDAWVLNHELAHIFTCLPFFGNFKEDSLLVHFDGGASQSNFSAWTFRNNKIELVENHWNLKYLTSMYNCNALVFGIIGAKLHDQNAVPGKMMGLASFGKYSSKIEDWLIDNNWFEELWGKRNQFWEKAKIDLGIEGKGFHTKNQFLQDVVATMQHVFVRDFTQKLKDLQQQTECKNLYLTGGCALNIVANSAIINQNIFEEVFIPPCTEDSGLALGAAAFMEWKKHGKVYPHSPYLNNWNLENSSFDIDDAEIEKIAELLYEEKVIAVCNGNGEAGPRALGNRSILALANSKQLAQKVSITHKGREWYRPVAPILLEEEAKYFTGLETIHPLAQYMLLDFDIIPERQTEMAGTVHVNGTARCQVIFNDEENPFIYHLLQKLKQKYNIRALINTSFNKRGEPIVHNSEGAIDSAKNLGIDGVIIDGKLKLF